jgi:acetylglutamate kinase
VQPLAVCLPGFSCSSNPTAADSLTQFDVESGQTLVDSGVIPVVATVASDMDGNALNINADTVAGEIAAGLGASKLILMTGASMKTDGME